MGYNTGRGHRACANIRKTKMATLPKKTIEKKKNTAVNNYN